MKYAAIAALLSTASAVDYAILEGNACTSVKDCVAGTLCSTVTPVSADPEAKLTKICVKTATCNSSTVTTGSDTKTYNATPSTCMFEYAADPTRVSMWTFYNVFNGIATLTKVDEIVKKQTLVTAFTKAKTASTVEFGCSACVRSGLEWWAEGKTAVGDT